MSSQNTLNFSKSALIGLQAELTRKKENLNHINYNLMQPSKLKIKEHIEQHVIKKPKIEVKADICEDEGKLIEAKLIEKSREALIEKTKLYDRLRNKELSLESEDCLVDFDVQIKNNDSYLLVNSDIEPDDDWVDYTDSFGRTRTCLREDLPYYKKIDCKLSADKTSNTLSDNENNGSAPKEISEELLLWDKKREELRKKWDEEEKVLSGKKDIHYQDILFDEARTHGVGYYMFSKDETVREKQQQELQRMRLETQINQQLYENLKEKREIIMKRRFDAARKRKEERLGLQAKIENDAVVTQE